MVGRKYAINGEFGQVRLCRSCITKDTLPLPYPLTDGGWHRCQEPYHFSRPQGMEEYLLLFTITSGGRLRIGDEPLVEIPHSSVSVLPANVPHEYCAAPESWWEFYWMQIPAHCAAIPEYLCRRLGYVFPLRWVPQIGELIENLFPERFSQDDTQYAITASQTISHIFHLMLEDECRIENPLKDNRTVQRVIARIESAYHQKLSMKDLAQENYLSEQHMIRLFRSATGCTPYEYLKKYRLLKARQLLMYTTLSPSEIAQQTGFSSVSNFICQFRREWGMPPGQYRQLHR